MIYKNFIYLFGCSMIVLNSLQTSTALSPETLTNNVGTIGDSNGASTSDTTVEVQLQIAVLTQRILTLNKDLLLEKKEIRELLGDNLEVLAMNHRIKTDLMKIGGMEIAIQYYLKKYPQNASLLESTVNMWRNAIDDLLSFKNDDISSKELHDKLKNANNLDNSRVFFEITNEVLVSKDRKMDGEEYGMLVSAVYMRLCTDYHTATTSKLKRVLFRKISSLYQRGAFDDIYKRLGEDVLEFLFIVMSPQYPDDMDIS